MNSCKDIKKGMIVGAIIGTVIGTAAAIMMRLKKKNGCNLKKNVNKVLRFVNNVTRSLSEFTK